MSRRDKDTGGQQQQQQQQQRQRVQMRTWTWTWTWVWVCAWVWTCGRVCEWGGAGASGIDIMDELPAGAVFTLWREEDGTHALGITSGSVAGVCEAAWTQTGAESPNVAVAALDGSGSGSGSGTVVCAVGDMLGGGAQEGGVRVLVRNSTDAGGWTADAPGLLRTTDAFAYDRIGYAVALSPAGLLATGAHAKKIDPHLLQGAAYVFRRSAPGAWLQVAALTAPDGGPGDYLGMAVALASAGVASATLAVGAPMQRCAPAAPAAPLNPVCGAVYVFRCDFSATPASCTLASKLAPAAPAPLRLGSALRLHPDAHLLLAGAPDYALPADPSAFPAVGATLLYNATSGLLLATRTAHAPYPRQKLGSFLSARVPFPLP